MTADEMDTTHTAAPCVSSRRLMCWARSVVSALLVGACHGSPPGQAPIPVPSPVDTSARSAATAESAREGTLNARAIGVLPFIVAATDSTVAPLAYGLADLLMTDLSRSSALQVVDRVRLDAVVRELQLASTGRMDSATAPRAGHLTGAGRLIIGTLASRGAGDLVVETRAVDVVTGRVQPAVSAHAPLASILDAEKALAFRVFSALGVALSPAEVAAVDQRPTKNIAALLAYSRAVRDEIGGNLRGADAQYGEAIKIDPSFALAQTRQASVRAQEAAPPVVAHAGGGHGERGHGPASPLVPHAPLPRLWMGLVDNINALVLSPSTAEASSVADASFPLSQLTTLFVFINVP